MAKFTKTSTPGIFRRHAKECVGGPCDCAYVVVWRHRGKQATETFRTFSEAREGQGTRKAGDRRPTSRAKLGDYFSNWIESYAGRNGQASRRRLGPSTVDRSRPRRSRAGGRGSSPMSSPPTSAICSARCAAGKSTSAIKKTRAALSAMFATAVDDGLISSNPTTGVRIPAAREDSTAVDEKPKALTRAELGLLLAAIDKDWRLFNSWPNGPSSKACRSRSTIGFPG